MTNDHDEKLAQLPDLYEQAARILFDHVGSDNRITSRELSDRLGNLDHLDSTPETRTIIRGLVNEYGLPVVSSTKGYFMVSNQEELEQYIDDLNSRIMGIEKRRDSLLSAVTENGLVGSESNLEDHINTENTEGDES